MRPTRSESGEASPDPAGQRRVNRNIEYQAIKGDLHERLIDELNRQGALARGDSELKSLIDQFVSDILETEDWPLNDSERSRLASDLLEETLGMGPLAPLMADPAVTDILVNRYDHVFVERFGMLEETDVRFRNDEHLVRIIGRIASRVGRRIDTSAPMVDARLPDGSRVNATLPPVTIDGPTLSIRRFGRRRLTRADLLRLGMFSDAMDRFLEALIRHRKSVIVTGGTGSGKSTLLGAIAEAIPDKERVITIEDAAELMLPQTHVIRMESRAPNTEGRGVISQRDLVVNALRMRPDRIVMGEVRAGEALDMLQAMNTGHDGSLTTIHANSPRDAFARLETMVMMAGMDLPSQAIREHAVSAVDYLVHVRRYEDGVRRIETITEVVGIEGRTPQLQDIFTFQPTGRSENRITGSFKATGVVPRIVDELISRGINEVDRNWFGR
ncbi:CpaF family protein [bacterium]|nr:CpaF family protein [bacterium]